MTQYRKRPVVIDAFQFVSPEGPFPAWFRQAFDVPGARVIVQADILVIHTLEGEMRGDLGDWIIKGVKGELYPCKPDIFAETYEPVVGVAGRPLGAVSLAAMDAVGAAQVKDV